VFVTDRFGSRLERLSMGKYELGSLDLATGGVSGITLFPGTDPWSPAWVGGNLYFIADPDGRPNVYRYDFTTRGIYRVTSLASGVSGITLLSPALSVDENADRLLFTVHDEDQYKIYRMKGTAALEGQKREASRTVARRTWAELPPTRQSSRVASWFDAPGRGLPSRERFPVNDYDPGLHLDVIGQPYVAAGMGRFDSFFGGGISFFFSDMLGYHNLGTQFQVNGGFDRIAAAAGYENRSSRWAWGGSISQIPYRVSTSQSGVAEVNGEHYGRYGRDSEDSRLSDLFLGYPNLVRGYEPGSFSSSECGADGCPVFERLFGSGLAVGNVEVRFPLLSIFGFDPWRGPVPVEVALFGDAGVAWNSGVGPTLFGGSRKPVSSAGVAFRVGLQQFFALEFDFVRPFDRPGQGWMFEFNIKPGF
jgi:Omp85 superfamily domain